jgi:hypothetical protein
MTTGANWVSLPPGSLLKQQPSAPPERDKQSHRFLDRSCPLPHSLCELPPQFFVTPANYLEHDFSPDRRPRVGRRSPTSPYGASCVQ